MAGNAIKKNLNSFNFQIDFFGASLKDKAIFARNLSIMLKAGLSITEALAILEEQSAPNIKRILINIAGFVAAGNPLSAGLQKYPAVFSHLFINTVKAGEASGNLEVNLLNIADMLDRERELRAKIKTAMVYPCIILLLSVGLAFTVSFILLPKITPIFRGLNIALPWSTRFLIWFTAFSQAHAVVLLAGMAGLAVFAAWLIRQEFARPFFHFLYLKIPIIGRVNRNKNLSLFSHILASLLKSGMSIDESLQVAEKTLTNHFYQKSISATSLAVSQGKKLSDCLAAEQKYFPPMAISLIRIGEKSGKLEEELGNLAVIYETEVDNAVKLLSAAVEPVLLIIIGSIVGGLALSIMTPIYQVTGSIMK